MSSPAQRSEAELPPVQSNGWPIPRSPRYLRPLEGIEEALRQPDRVRDQMQRHGFALLRSLLPAELVMRACEAYRTLLKDAPAGSGAGYGTAGHPAHAFVRGEAFERLCATPELRAVAEIVLGAPARLLRRRPFRHYDGGSGLATRAHRDWSYLDRGTKDVVTIWLPLLPCGLADGPLVYLDKSRDLDTGKLKDGLRGRTDRPEAHQVITNDLKGLAELSGNAWLYPETRLGDVLMHDPFTIHASLDCSAGAHRISTDLRLIKIGDTPDPRWDADWSADDGH